MGLFESSSSSYSSSFSQLIPLFILTDTKIEDEDEDEDEEE
jgi:hypothetical protein